MEKKRIVSYVFKEYNERITPKVPNLNIGGCGVFAEHLYKLLISVGVKPKIVVITDNIAAMNDRILNNGDEWGAIIKHIVLFINGKYIDSDGVYNSVKDIHHNKYGTLITDKLTIEVLEKWNKGDFWNECFDKKKYTPFIKKQFKGIEKKVVKEFA